MRPANLALFALLALLVATALAVPATLATADPVDCATCHHDDAKEGRFPLRDYRRGVHADLACTTCHEDEGGAFAVVPHKGDRGEPKTCTICHGKDLKEFRTELRGGIHGAMACTECHGWHDMPREPSALGEDARRHAANAACLRCHAEEDLAGAAKSHGWLPSLARHARMRCLACHAALEGEHDHEVLPRAQAVRACEACHAQDGFLVAKRAPSEDRSGWVENPVLFRDAYVPGAVRNRRVDATVLWLLALTVGGALAHGLLRALTAPFRAKAPYAVVSIDLYPAGLRLWHWANAALFLVLAATGMRLHFGGRGEPILTFEQAFNLHNLAGFAFVVATVLFYVRGAVTRDLGQYLGKPQDGIPGIVRQAGYYLVGIFRGAPHPYHASKARRFNPMQQVAYAVTMFVLLPILVVSGVVLLYPGVLPERIGGRSAVWWVATAHYLAGVAGILFVLLHLYLTTTGDRLGYLLLAMITGRHRHHVSKGGADAKASPPKSP